MVAPVLLAAGAAIAGTAVGSAVGSMFSKKEASSITTHAPYEVYNPEIQYHPQSTYTYSPQMTYVQGSPYATVTPTKKDILSTEQTAEPQMTGSTVPMTTSAQAGSVEGIDVTMIAVIAVIGLLGYGAIQKVL